jgi:hypothetical protein
MATLDQDDIDAISAAVIAAMNSTPPSTVASALGPSAVAQILSAPTMPPLILDMSPLVIELPNSRNIIISWPVDGATIQAAYKNSLGNYTLAAGSVVQVSSASDDYEYRFNYHINDRPQQPAGMRYRFTDGVYTRYLNVSFRLPTTYIDSVVNEDAF